MNTTGSPSPKHWTADLRVGIVTALLMLAIPLAAKLATRAGWVNGTEFSQRSLFVIMGIFLVLTGNTIPKRLARLPRAAEDAARSQSFYRFAGWTWVITGLVFGLAWLVLPLNAAGTATFIILPIGMALIAVRCMFFMPRQPSA